MVWCGTRGPEGVGNLYSARYWKFKWMRPWAFILLQVWSWSYVKQENRIQTSRCPCQHYSSILGWQSVYQLGQNSLWWSLGIFVQMSEEGGSSEELKGRCGLSHNACDLGRSINPVTFIFFRMKILALKKPQHKPTSVCFLAVLKSHQIQTSFPNTCDTFECVVLL